MKDLHLCPMDLLVFIFSPNMVSMRSTDTVAHVLYSMWHWCVSAHSHAATEEGSYLQSVQNVLTFIRLF